MYSNMNTTWSWPWRRRARWRSSRQRRSSRRRRCRVRRLPRSAILLKKSEIMQIMLFFSKNVFCKSNLNQIIRQALCWTYNCVRGWSRVATPRGTRDQPLTEYCFFKSRKAPYVPRLRCGLRSRAWRRSCPRGWSVSWGAARAFRLQETIFIHLTTSSAAFCKRSSDKKLFSYTVSIGKRVLENMVKSDIWKLCLLLHTSRFC